MRTIPVFFFCLTALAAGCNSPSPTEKVCQAASAQLFRHCDPNVPADILLIQMTLARFGVAATEEDVRSTTKDDVEYYCETIIRETGVTVTEPEAAEFIATLEEGATCQQVVDIIQASTPS